MNNLKRFTKSIFSCIALSGLLFLGGCETLPPMTDLSPITVDNAAQAKAWELQGKLAIRTPEDKLSANLYWRHSEERDELTLTTMLGTTVLTLEATPHSAHLHIDGKDFRDNNAQALLERVSGWSIPINDLPLWITGQTGSLDRVIAVDSTGQTKQLQNVQTPPPWLVTFLSWQSQSGAKVPYQLTLERGDLQLKLQLNQWQALGKPSILLGEKP
ncbi:lipoprotein insertase outer membrane protein LolB [Shewanella xiamenensis]|uniref:lipoprotein insertase outer membrane protein LolB n=1 Tax=Shewanella TaxID=22 RepID=UPI00002C57C7|nr:MULTISPECIES: lipoprotein insertase outer membrane protein LolB [Shewanella]KPN76976.1 membrane protein [Shewanella sp. Sh95]MBW0280221.1 outer membrane lipoprotein LolB [Shewanella xiamenensis]MCT8861314.1 lipoprotein insertase outer membrane protein LolB [Shewanella xiamenensis]MCT8871417.1 lipoprotein insertase outer membrane protein LolB [Shewanella xiamenensis]MDH1315650.1 lipoprotein insertase outer membrane protein LolB [Shewanella xiamenensis]